MFTADRLKTEIEARFPVGPSTCGALAVTGEPYVSIGYQSDGVSSIPGTIDEGKARELNFEEEDAYFSARSAFEAYAEERTGTLYWRVLPQHETGEINGHVRGYIYMRLLISDSPALALTEGLASQSAIV